MQVEMIVAAALKRGNLVYSAPRPARHGDVMRLVDETHGDMHEPFLPDEQGFLTSAGRFVNRRLATSIAVRAEQIIDPQWPPDLYSEDLW